jgi:hypothetical protein
MKISKSSILTISAVAMLFALVVLPATPQSATAAPPATIEGTIFSFNYADGYYPEGGVVFDRDGNLDGITDEGGEYDYGSVFSNLFFRRQSDRDGSIQLHGRRRRGISSRPSDGGLRGKSIWRVASQRCK